MKKKVFSLALVMCIIASLFVAVPMTVSANTYSFKNGTLSYEITNNQVTVTECDISSSCSLTIPSTLSGYPVTAIGECAFYCCDNLSSVTIPGSVTTIRICAFESCENLTSVTMEKGVTTIGERAFQNCKKLSSVTIPNSVTTIGVYAFTECTGLSSITIPDSVTTIEPCAFEDTAWYDKQPDGLVYAGNVAYKYKGTMPANTKIILKDGTRAIACEAFILCNNLSSITIPKSLVNIGYQAFFDCTSLNNINVDANNPNYSSQDGVIYNKDKTTLILCPCGKKGAFTIPSSVKIIADNSFLGCDKISSIIIPDSVTNIGAYAFAGCHSLKSIAIPDGITTIEDETFSGCKNITSVTIPDSVTTIKGQAFEYCINIKEVLYSGNKSKWKAISFGFNNQELTEAKIHYNYNGYIGILNLDYNEGVVESTVRLFDVDAGSVAYLAVYDGSKLVSAGKKTIGVDCEQISMTASATLTGGNTYTVKLFVWDENMKPIMRPVIETLSVK